MKVIVEINDRAVNAALGKLVKTGTNLRPILMDPTLELIEKQLKLL